MSGDPGHTSRSSLPARAGAGFKPEHADEILADSFRIGFLEVHAENYMGAGGHPHRILTRMREDFPLSIHGVSMSIGSPTGLDRAHLERLKAVADRYQPAMVSEHLAWSTHDSHFFNDLLPVPYDEATLSRVCEHVHQVQERLGRRILLENPSTYVAFEATTMRETDFIRQIAERTGCGLLLDINNVHVSATNHGYGAIEYLSDFPLDRVEEIHLAGHAEDLDDEGLPLLIDSHDRPVDDKVWKLYDLVLARTGPLPTLIEWDNDVPDWPILKREALRADARLERHAENHTITARERRHAR
ncbi:DUF692 family multinuclear iron-containing protein [Rhizobium sp. AAP43]|uniref:MNIO family bufferin maturase n=1 Tax=Rhizobium sp. AAP43 TaxID=1523420 RepID=UPI0006BA0458|nr:DUF692 domain-containing protein [Rhizobium sp. AAP43]KPF46291.1 hypothetical protein IP76_05205 [Rhizobium sp. AAP43]